jgi:two-component system, OmpR family, aerobic respiration control sensor histidine kinase ArcB
MERSSIRAGENKLKTLVEIILQQYQHILSEGKDENTSAEKIIESIVNYYQDIINSMPGNVFWLNKDCVTLGCNKNVLDMFGFTSIDEFKDLTFEAMGKIGKNGPWAPPESIQLFKNDTLEVLRTGKPSLNVEDPPILHHDGRSIYFLTSRVPLFGQDGSVIGTVGISIDITELKNTQAALKNAKEQAEMASQAKSEFVTNMSHDIITPLSGIIGTAELLTYRLEGENLEFAQSLLMSGRQLLHFFDNCLQTFKLENCDFSLTTEYFEIKNVVNEIHDLFKPAIKSKNLAFKVNYHADTPTYLLGSKTALYRVLLNLVGNAVKFTHQGCITIDIGLEKKDPDGQAIVNLSVQDTGIGIPKSKHKIIFERFIRLSPSYKGSYEGSGIGLYVVKTIVAKMHGEIHLDSEKGKGSRFRLLLPFQILSQPEQQSEGHILPSPQEQQDIQLKKPVKILLVEDNHIARQIENSLFTSMGCEVEAVERGEQALEVFEPGKYHLIFMDIGLPGLQGDIISKLIRKMEQGSSYQVPILGLTAHLTEDLNKHCQTAGINAVFNKPLSYKQAKKIIQEYYSD